MISELAVAERRRFVTVFLDADVLAAGLVRTLVRQWKKEFLACWDTNCTSNGGTEAINNLISHSRCIPAGCRVGSVHRPGRIVIDLD